MAMATPADPQAQASRGRGRGRGRGGARSHQQSRPCHAGLVSGGSLGDAAAHQRAQELSVLERTAHKFCHSLYGCVREEALMETAQADREWLVVTLHEDPIPPRQVNANESWRSMREKLEAVSVLSVLAGTESCAWRRNGAFWRRFTQLPDRPAQGETRGTLRPHRPANSLSVPRDDMSMPRFKLDFAFAEITADVVALLGHVLMGSKQAMRHSFKLAMAALARIPPRTRHAATVPIALRFARCQFGGDEILQRLVALVETVNRARQRRHRERSQSTSRAMYYQVVELDLSNVRLTDSDLQHLRRLGAVIGSRGGFRLVLDNAITASTDQILPFGSVVLSWFDPQSSTTTTTNAEKEWNAEHTSVPGVTSVSLHGSALSSRHVASLFSAIHSTGPRGSISQLWLRRAFQCCDPQVAWAWVAFGVWSRDTSSRLVSLDLSGNVLRLEDAAVVRQVMTARDDATRAQVLYRLTTGTAATNSSHYQAKKISNHRRKSQRATRKVEPSEPSRAHPSWVCLHVGTKLTLTTADKTVRLSLTSPTVVRVVEMRSAHDAVVLVSGYGFLEVDLASAVPVQIAEEDEEGQPHNHHLQELKLNSMVVLDGAEQPDAVFDALFSTVSLPALTKLELNRNPLGQSALRAILSACPSLRSLSVEDCELDSIRAILDAYAAGVCRLQSLNLTENTVGDHDIVDLCRLIRRGAACPASRLQVLHLHQNPLTYRGIHALSVVVREIPDALVELVLDKTHDPDAHYRAVFYPFHDQFLGVDPLSDAHRREFHHALARLLPTTTLEPSIVDRIHAYAASNLHRRIVWMGSG